jgi:hypothetical protein
MRKFLIGLGLLMSAALPVCAETSPPAPLSGQVRILTSVTSEDIAIFLREAGFQLSYSSVYGESAFQAEASNGIRFHARGSACHADPEVRCDGIEFSVHVSIASMEPFLQNPDQPVTLEKINTANALFPMVSTYWDTDAGKIVISHYAVLNGGQSASNVLYTAEMLAMAAEAVIYGAIWPEG